MIFLLIFVVKHFGSNLSFFVVFFEALDLKIDILYRESLI